MRGTGGVRGLRGALTARSAADMLRSAADALRAGAGVRRLDPRTSLPAFWRWCNGRVDERRQVATSAFLRRRRLLLPALALAVLGFLSAAYFGVHGSNEHIQERQRPALIQLELLRGELIRAQQEAVRRYGPDAEGTRLSVGEKFQRHLTRARQSLEQATQSGALDAAQQQELGVVSGLLTTYVDKIDRAERRSDSEPLRRAMLQYAAGILCAPDEKDPFRCVGRKADDTCPQQSAGENKAVTLLDRTVALESQVRCDMRAEADSSAPLALGLVAYALSVVLAPLLIGTFRFVRDQLRLYSLPLLALSLAIACCLALLTWRALVEHEQQVAAAPVAGAAAAPRSTGGADRRAAVGRVQAVEGLDGGLTQVVRVGVGLGAAAAVGCGLAFQGYVRAYPTKRRRPLR